MQILSMMTSSVVRVQWCDTKLRISLPIMKQFYLKLGRDVAPYEIYQMAHIVILPWQHVWFQSLTLKNQILPFVAARGKYTIKNVKKET